MTQKKPTLENDMDPRHPLFEQAKAYCDGKILNLLVFFICALNIVGADGKLIQAAFLVALFQIFFLWIEGVGRRRVTLLHEQNDEDARVS